MAHDRQLEPGDLIGDLSPKSALTATKQSAEKFLDVLADWWSIFGQIYRDDPTAELAVAFREVLAPLKPEILHQACLIACRECPEFRPKPGQIYEIAQSILAQRQEGNRPKWLDEPMLTAEEREAELHSTEYRLLRAKIVGGVK